MNKFNIIEDLNNEQRELLIKEISYRLPYNTKFASFSEDFSEYVIGNVTSLTNEFKQYGYTDIELRIDTDEYICTIVDFCRPVLRRPETLTLLEIKELDDIIAESESAAIEWLYKHNIDVNNLIENGWFLKQSNAEYVVVAPIQNLCDETIQKMRDASIKIIRALGIRGGCNIQFALNPENDEYKVVVFSEPVDVSVPKSIVYVSEGLEKTGKKTVTVLDKEKEIYYIIYE